MNESELLEKIEQLKEARRYEGDAMRKAELNRELVYYAQKLTALED